MNKNNAASSRKEREKKQRQEEIFLAAKILFANNGYGATTMEDISKKAEFAKGTLYNFFPSKEELFASLITSEFDKLLELIEKTITSELTQIEKLRELIRTQLYFFENNKDFFKLITTEAYKITSELKCDKMNIIKEKHKSHNAYITSFFEKATSSGTFKNIEPHFLAYTLIGIVRSVSLYHFMECTASAHSKSHDKLTDHTETIMTLFLDGARGKNN